MRSVGSGPQRREGMSRTWTASPRHHEEGAAPCVPHLPLVHLLTAASQGATLAAVPTRPVDTPAPGRVPAAVVAETPVLAPSLIRDSSVVPLLDRRDDYHIARVRHNIP